MPTTYIVAFKNPWDKLGMRNLLLQVFPNQCQEVQGMFRKVTEGLFGCMVLDLHPKSDDDLRILSHLLKEEGCIQCHQFPRTAMCLVHAYNESDL